MTQTRQLCSLTYLDEAGKNLAINKKCGAEDNMSFLLQVYDNLNTLNGKLSSLEHELNRLDYVIHRKT